MKIKLFNLFILVTVLGVIAVFLPQNSWAGGVSVGIGIGIPLPLPIYAAPVYYPAPYAYGPPVVYGPPVFVTGGPAYRYYDRPYHRYHKPRYYSRHYKR